MAEKKSTKAQSDGYTMTVIENGKKVTYRATTQEVVQGSTPFRVKVVQKVSENPLKG